MSATAVEPRFRFRESYRDIRLYAPDRAPCACDLSDNTNLFGTSPAAMRALGDASAAGVTRYPGAYAQALKNALAGYAGVAAENIVTGCGSDDVLDSAIRAFSEPKDCIAFSDPTFAMLPIFARMNGLIPRTVSLAPDFAIDVDGLLATGARIIYLCSPNNPTGTPAGEASVGRLLERFEGLVILDEAYAEFAGSGWMTRAATSTGQFVVVRTLSKAFGLAGLRIGYAVGRADLVTEIEKSRGPYKVSNVAERAALAALGEGQPWMRARIDDVHANRERLAFELKQLGLIAIPSNANFLCVPVAGATALAAACRERGVAVRPFSALTGIGDAIRITIGPWDMMEKCLAALEASLQCK